MGTVAITASGFANLTATPPNNWASNIVWPIGGNINGTKTYTISQTDAEFLLSWIATNYNSNLIGTATPPVTITAISMLVAWLNGFMKATTDSVQRQQTAPPVVPPPISIT